MSSSRINSKTVEQKKKVSLDFNFPSIELLENPKKTPGVEVENRRNTEVNKALLANVLSDFKINGEITEVKQGPIVTLFELTPAPGTQSSVFDLDDIADQCELICTNFYNSRKRRFRNRNSQ